MGPKDQSRVSQESTWTSCDPNDTEGIWFWECDDIVDWDGDLIITSLLTIGLWSILETMTCWELIKNLHDRPLSER